MLVINPANFCGWHAIAVGNLRQTVAGTVCFRVCLRARFALPLETYLLVRFDLLPLTDFADVALVGLEPLDMRRWSVYPFGTHTWDIGNQQSVVCPHRRDLPPEPVVFLWFPLTDASSLAIRPIESR